MSAKVLCGNIILSGGNGMRITTQAIEELVGNTAHSTSLYVDLVQLVENVAPAWQLAAVRVGLR